MRQRRNTLTGYHTCLDEDGGAEEGGDRIVHEGVGLDEVQVGIRQLLAVVCARA